MLDKTRISDGLNRFADLDCVVRTAEVSNQFVVQLAQQGEQVVVSFDTDGKVTERRDGEISGKYSSYKGLLASRHFGNIRRLVDAQKALLLKDAPYFRDIQGHLPIVGNLEATAAPLRQKGLLDDVDEWLLTCGMSTVRTLVIDGPAGVGKSHLIRRLVHDRATNFGPGSSPPILHIRSKGRKLTTLTDVIAGSLQELRLSLTFDQLPVLIREGLIGIAIDGFDELADPNGYENSWGLLRNFVEEIRGQGCLILAGRDTFIDYQTVQKALPALDTENMAAVHVRLIEPDEATSWLEFKGWKASQISYLKDAGLLDQGSYALRPFFIQQIWRYGEDAQGFSKFLSFPLNALLENMLTRESNILKDSFHTKPHIGLEDNLMSFFKEVAREMADAETEHVDTASLSLISDLVFQSLVSAEDLGMLRYRAPALSLLEQEMTPSQRRFPHSEIQDYFTAKSYFDLIRDGEISKALRRNILGTDILETFHDVCVSSNQDEADVFRESAYRLIRQQIYDDRSRKNLPALLLASLYDSEKPTPQITLSYINLDECCLRDTLPKLHLEQVMVSLLDVRGADISKVVFDKCQIGSLIADSTTRLPVGFPSPGILTLDISGRAESVHDQREVLSWIKSHTEQPDVGVASSKALSVLERICRAILRQNWIRETAVDDRAARLLEDEYWPQIREILSENGLLGLRQGVAAAGPRSNFVRVLRAKDLLTEELADPVVHRVRERVKKLG